MKFYQKNKEKVLAELNTSKKGLKKSQLKSLRKKFGFNEVKEKKESKFFKILWDQLNSVIIYVMFVALILAIILGEWIDASIIGVVIIANTIFGFVQEFKAEKAIAALKEISHPQAIVIRNGEEKIIPAKNLLPGDILVIEEGTKIPADCYILEAYECRTDESLLTGESIPVEKKEGIIKNKVPVSEQHNMFFSGTTCVSGRAIAVCTATGMETELGKIASLIQIDGKKETPLQKKLNLFAKYLSLGVVGIIIIIFILGILRGFQIWDMLLTSISLAVAAIPEGLPAVVTIALSIATQRLVKKNVMLRKLSAAETLGSTTVICSDKTGTITKNEMTVTQIFANDMTIEVTGSGYKPKGKFLATEKVNKKHLQRLMECAYLCNNSALTNKGIIGDPTEGALKVVSKKAGFTPNYKRVDEIPFSSEKKFMTTVNKIGDKEITFIKGAPEIILKKCVFVYNKGKLRRMTDKERKIILKQNNAMTSSALRTLAFAFSNNDRFIFLGLMGMIDPPREHVVSALQICKEAGIKTIMITGDHIETAKAIAKQVGLGDNAITGKQLNLLTKNKLHKQVEKINIYARVSPQDKVKILKALQKKKNFVAMTGDGVNDAPALEKAEIGVAVGDGTDVAKGAADMILLDNDFASIVRAVKEGRTIYTNIKRFVRYLLSCNLGEILTIFFSMVIGLGQPIIAIQILWMNLVTDLLPATALSFEPADPGTMKKPPRKPNEKIISKDVIIDIFLIGIISALGSLLLFYFSLPKGMIYAQTMAFTTLVIFQLYNVFNMRSERSIFKTKFFRNMKLLYAILISLSLQLVVIYTPLNIFFETVPLGVMDWVWILLVALSVIVVIEIKKLLKRFIFS